MWLVGVVVRRYVDFLILLVYPYCTCIRLFLCNIVNTNIVQRTFEIVQKSRSHGHGDIIISTSTSTTSQVPRFSRARFR